MTDRRRGLGRGLGALIPTRTLDDRASSPNYDEVEHRPDDRRIEAGAERGVNGVDIHEATSESDSPRLAYFAEIPLGAIRTNPRQPRQVFDEDTLAELAHSIREVGVLQPIVVRELPDPSPVNVEAGGDRSANYELVMGERRMRAAQSAGLATIPAIVRETKDDALLRDALLENLHRAQLNPLEEAAAYDQMLADFGCTQDELAQKIGKSRPQISNTLRLLRLPPEVQRRIAAGVLSAGHARALLGLDDSAAQERMAQRVVAEGLSVRTVEELVALGDLGTSERAPRRQHAPVAPALTELGARLSERFETRVKVDLGRRKGKITIEFASIADLERIVAVMDPAPEARSHADWADAELST